MNKGDMGKRRKEKGIVVEGSSGTRKITVVDNHDIGLPKGILEDGLDRYPLT